MKMKLLDILKFKKLLLLCLVCSTCSVGYGQALQQLQNSLNRYTQNTVQEKLFVHTDKSTYLAGELIWFKIYSVDANTNKPIDLSKVAYVEITDRLNNPVLQAKIAMTGGSGAGSLYLPLNTANSNYKLRAYTSWMKNFNAAYYFEKALTIVNPMLAPAATATAGANQDVQFFPEGGNLVAGIASKVAFKATGKNGKGVEKFYGAIINQSNDTVARFKPLKFGIGSFTFTPSQGSTYKAILKFTGSAPVVKELPAAKATGYVMSLAETTGNQLQVTVKSNAVTGNVYLLAHTRQAPKVALSAALNNQTATFTFDRAKLGEGISAITVFNDAKQPVCERLYFVQPSKKLLLDAVADQTQYASRRKVNVDISAKNTAGASLVADLSLSVYRVDSLQGVDRNDILSYLWLKSDLKGAIESPEYYLENNTAEAREALDNLLLSQGWRRFEWNDIASGKQASFKYLPEYNGHIVTATITSPDKSPVGYATAYMGIPGKLTQVYNALSDSTGILRFNAKHLFGPGELIVQTDRTKDSVSRIEVQSPFSDAYTPWDMPAFGLSASQRQALEEHSLAMQSLNIYSGDKIRKFYGAVTDSSAFYGNLGKTYRLDNFTRFATMEEVLREYVTEVSVSKSGSNFSMRMLSNKIGFLDGTPLILLDGVPVFNVNKIVAIDPLKINKLEAVPYNYYLGLAKYPGIVNFTTYKGDLGGIEMDPNAVVIDYEGMQLQREFYSPVYDTDAQMKSRLPDLRNLLYWSPSIITGNGKNQVSFYTSDKAGSYIGVLQGITANGDAGVKYFNIEVK